MGKTRKRLDISPERIRSKLDECNFFLKEMTESVNPDEFGYYLSAFLAAFKTFTELGQQCKYAKGRGNAPQFRSNPLITLLLDLRDIEVHREGIRIWGYTRLPLHQLIPRKVLGGQLLETPQFESSGQTPLCG